MKLENKEIIVVVIIILVALLAGSLSAYQYIDSANNDKKNEKTTQQLIKAQEDLNTMNHEISKAQKTSITLSEELKIAQQKAIKNSDELIIAQAKINDLQSEIISQVVGYGYPVLKLMNSQGANFTIYLQASSNYPIHKVYFSIIDAEKLMDCDAITNPTKVTMSKSCYDHSLITQSYGSIDLNGQLMTFIDTNLPKKNYYLITEFICKNITVTQYSIVKYDGQNLEQDYRVYEISKESSKFIKLIENSNQSISEDEYKRNFFLQKTIIIDASK